MRRQHDSTPLKSDKLGPDMSGQSRFLLAAIVESSDDAIISKNLDGIITSWNQAASRMFGYAAHEMIGQSILRLIPERLHSEEEMILEKLRAGERIDHFETTRVKKNGELVAVALTVSPVRDGTGKIIGASKIARDISERKRNEELLARLAAIVQSSDDAIISKDLDGKITSWNEAAGRMFGYTPAEIIGQPILRLIPEELRPEEDAILKKLRAGERIDHYETVRVRKSGERFDASVTISPVIDRQGNVTGASKIARDITERKQMQRLLIQSEKLAATGRMAATIAHEVNNPLESIMNLVFLARTSNTINKARPYLQTAESELERVSHIARQTLGYYREGGLPAIVHMQELIEDVLTVYQGKLSARAISVDCRFDHHPRMTANRGELIQVFSNIIANSIDAMPRGGVLRIQIGGTLDPEGVKIDIRDQGVGIQPEHLLRVFEPFFTTKGNLGTGIGLWVVKQLIEKHRGQIGLTSSTEAKNSGTAVSIFLPLVRPASASEVAKAREGVQIVE